MYSKRGQMMEKRMVKIGVGSLFVLLVAGPSVVGSGVQAAAQSNSSGSIRGASTLPAVALKKSLTAEQQQALSAVMDQFKPQLSAIAARVESSLAQNDSDKNAFSADASASVQAQADLAKGAFAQLKDVQSQIDSATASILSSEQFALHKQASSGVLDTQALANAEVPPAAAAGQGPALQSGQSAALTGGDEGESFSSSYCFSGVQYASIARYWAYYAYSNAYTNYVYYDSDSNAYYAYYYLYLAQSYAKDALQELGAAYFDITQLGSDFNSLGSSGASDAYYAYYYAYYGAASAYNNYYSTGGSGYAYYAYVYGTYAKNNSYNSYAYGLYCH